MSEIGALVLLADWHGPGWWIVFVPIGWFLVFLLVFFAFRRGRWSRACGWGSGPRFGRGGWGGSVHPIEVLDRRFAEGEIDAHEYRSRRATLEKSRAEGK